MYNNGHEHPDGSANPSVGMKDPLKEDSLYGGFKV